MPALDREEYIEQAHLFRVVRERMEENTPIQETLEQVREEILATTKLPMAIDFLLGEIRHAGRLSPGMAQLKHYFAPFQTYIMERAEQERGKFDVRIALEILAAEAKFRAHPPTPAGLFFFQFECLARNKLGYDKGMAAIAGDPTFDADWSTWILKTRLALGASEFCDLVYLRSEYFRQEQTRLRKPAPEEPSLFGRHEGRIARAHRNKDPLYFFSAIQRQLEYPAAPRPAKSGADEQLPPFLEARLQRLEKRLQIMEAEANDKLDLSEFYVRHDELPRDE